MINTFYILNTFVCMPNCLHPHINTKKGQSLEMDIFSKDLTLCVQLKYPSRVTIPLRLCTGCVESDGGHEVFLCVKKRGSAACVEKNVICAVFT